MSDEGQFRNTNGIIVNSQDDRERMKNAIEHEYAHQILYILTTYGQMMLMLEKNK
ncbi:hypothetical protein [Butyrivibrio sp. AE3006]|uniref:hypothetical protein n=1 Tax=Butyrivibrio sp. AE3006 TaxID=1280673 RepID=UPI0012DEA2F3|nr:hypothetical protein [Butyrivibrio sp. AE3006]